MNKKNVLIFGGTGDLGQKVLDYFFKSKYNIVFSSTSQKMIKKTQAKYSNYEKSLIGIICNFREENDIKKIINFSYIITIIYLYFKKLLYINHLINSFL
jgi:FlaA1/EpsC-like NDP-sugar epimerase